MQIESQHFEFLSYFPYFPLQIDLLPPNISARQSDTTCYHLVRTHFAKNLYWYNLFQMYTGSSVNMNIWNLDLYYSYIC